MSWGDVSYLLRSKLSVKILEALNKEMAPKQISEATDIARSNVSTKLAELSKRGLVRCLNPKDRKWRFYIITDKGKTVLKRARQAKN